MNCMRERILLASIIVLFCEKAISQEHSLTIGAGPAISFSVSNSNFKYYYKSGIGGSIQAGFGVTKLGSLTISSHFFSIGVKNPPVSKLLLTMIKGGYRTNFLNSKIFAGTEGGIAIYSSKKTNGTSYFTLSGRIGYSLPISKKSFLEIFPAYSRIFGSALNSQWLSVNVLYCYKLK